MLNDLKKEDSEWINILESRNLIKFGTVDELNELKGNEDLEHNEEMC